MGMDWAGWLRFVVERGWAAFLAVGFVTVGTVSLPPYPIGDSRGLTAALFYVAAAALAWAAWHPGSWRARMAVIGLASFATVSRALSFVFLNDSALSASQVIVGIAVWLMLTVTTDTIAVLAPGRRIRWR